MARRGRSAPAPARSAPVRQAAPAPARQAAPVPAPAPAAAPPMVAQPQQPSLFGQMAATAGGVAIGSAIGHTVGHAMTGMFGGSSDAPQQQPAQAAPVQQQYAPAGATEPTGACAWEIKQFLQCAQGQSDLTLCDGFNEALRQCKASAGI